MNGQKTNISGDKPEYFAMITDKARIVIDGVEYDSEKKTVKIPVKRYSVSGKKRGLFSKAEKPVFDREKTLNSIIQIANVSDFKLKNICDSNTKEITILFGVQIDLNSIYISSAEEYQGESLYEIEIKTDDMHVEIIDT